MEHGPQGRFYVGGGMVVNYDMPNIGPGQHRHKGPAVPPGLRSLQKLVKVR